MGAAVKLTAVPAQMVVWLAVTLTLASKLLLMVITTGVELAGLPVMHPVPLPPAVIVTLTASLLAKLLLVKVEAVAPPTSVPFTRHW